MTTNATVVLSRGVEVDGERHREAHLRPLTGEDEAFLLEARHLTHAERVSALLRRCISRLGSLSPVPPGTVGELTVGDRETLLLHLRRVTLGETMQCILPCPHSGCGEPMDLDIGVSEILLPPQPRDDVWHEVSVDNGGTTTTLRFRLPTAADLEAVAVAARGNTGGATRLLLERCLPPRNGAPSIHLPSEAASLISEAMAEADPQAEINLTLDCPACGHSFSVVFDTASYFLEELAGRSRFLYREVHQLAFHYHWSEREILRMTPEKRRRYLALLAEELSGGHVP